MEKVKQKVIRNYCTIQNYGSRTIAPEENCPLNPKTNPKPNPNPNQGQFFLGAIVWLTPNPTTNPDLNPNSNPNRGAIFLGGQLSGYRKLFTFYFMKRLN